MCRERLFNMPKRGARLLAFDHAVDFFDLTHQVGAAELELLAASARAHCIGIDGHEIIRNAAERLVRADGLLPAILADMPRSGDPRQTATNGHPELRSG